MNIKVLTHPGNDPAREKNLDDIYLSDEKFSSPVDS